MKQIAKIIFVIIGTIIGAGFASRARNLLILWKISNCWNNRNFCILCPNGNFNLQNPYHEQTRKHRKLRTIY